MNCNFKVHIKQLSDLHFRLNSLTVALTVLEPYEFMQVLVKKKMVAMFLFSRSVPGPLTLSVAFMWCRAKMLVKTHKTCS